jgi:hypothetical protein
MSDKSVYYLTPVFAGVACEQIEAWYHEQTGKAKAPDLIDTSNMNNIRLEGALAAAHVSMSLLLENDFAQCTKEQVGPCGLTDYFREERSYKIDLARLKSFAARKL